MKGAAHLHSTYSDGEFTLSQLREIFLIAGCRFLCVTDHAEAFDAEKLSTYQQECAALSDSNLTIVPGLEYRCERDMHILGYGAMRPIASEDPQTVIRAIDEQGAISVIAHPKDDFFSWIETFQVLPAGIEAWNSKYDGRYAPRPATFAFIQRLQLRKPSLRAFYGQDLHWKKQFRGLFLSMDSASMQAEDILSNLAKGAFRGEKDLLMLPSSGALPDDLMSKFAKSQNISRGVRGYLKKAKKGLDRIGVKVPKSLKAELRKVF